jgi:hypothetical protein
MSNATARFFIPLLRLLFPARGCHRSTGAVPVPVAMCADEPRPALPRVPVRHSAPLRGEDSALVRPYALTPKERRERGGRRVQRGCWRAPLLAVHGFDADPRWIHGVDVMG